MIATYAQWLRWRSCGRKQALTYLEANAVTLAAWRAGDLELQPYPCRFAADQPHWHVGHVRQRGAA